MAQQPEEQKEVPIAEAIQDFECFKDMETLKKKSLDTFIATIQGCAQLDLKHNVPPADADEKTKESYKLEYSMFSRMITGEKTNEKTTMNLIDEVMSFKGVKLKIRVGVYWTRDPNVKDSPEVRNIAIMNIDFAKDVTYGFILYELIPKLFLSMTEESTIYFFNLIQTLLANYELFRKEKSMGIKTYAESVVDAIAKGTSANPLLAPVENLQQEEIFKAASPSEIDKIIDIALDETRYVEQSREEDKPLTTQEITQLIDDSKYIGLSDENVKILKELDDLVI